MILLTIIITIQLVTINTYNIRDLYRIQNLFFNIRTKFMQTGKEKKSSYCYDVWNQWTTSSLNIPFKSASKCVGNGENKLANELQITTSLGGQNSIVDLHHQELGNISVKDMTNDDCTLGTEGSQRMREVFMKILYPLPIWCEKYKDTCQYANNICDKLNQSYGQSRISILKGIERSELSGTNFAELNKIIQDIQKQQNNTDITSLQSEYIIDICKHLHNETLIEKINTCVRKEATNMTLIIVHEKKGWMIIKDLTRITCPRITRGAPRIHID